MKNENTVTQATAFFKECLAASSTFQDAFTNTRRVFGESLALDVISLQLSGLRHETERCQAIVRAYNNDIMTSRQVGKSQVGKSNRDATAEIANIESQLISLNERRNRLLATR